MADTILEKDTISVTVGDDHTCNCSVVTIGRTGENTVTQLEFTIPKELNSFWAYLDFKKPKGETHRTGKLDIVNNKIEYDIPNGLLDQNGNLEVQLVLHGANGEIWKSATKKFVVLKSIDAVVDVPAVEDFIADAVQTLQEIDGKINGALDYVDEVYATNDRANNLEKRVTNLEQGIIPSPFETDSTTAYRKYVPSNALPYAEVEKIGGMTRKSKNLFNPSKLLATETWSVNASGVYSGSSGYLKNAFTKSNPYMTFENVDSLTLSFYGYFAEGQSPNGLYFQFSYDDGTTESFSVKSTTETYYTYTTKAGVKPVSLCFSYGNAGGTHYLRNIQIEKGTVATEYEPYFDGLRSAPVTEVESVGANLIPYPYSETTKTLNGITFTDNGDGSVTVNGTATNTSGLYLSKNNLNFFKVGQTYSLSGGADQVKIDILFQGVVWGGAKFTITEEMLNAPNINVEIRIEKGTSVSNVKVYPMLNEGSTALPYSPYARNTLPIPTEVQALDGYGDGINDTCYNYVDWEKKQFVKRVGKVDMGSLEWFKVDNVLDFTYFAYVADMKVATDSDNRKAGFICSHYNPSTNVDNTALDDKSMIRHSSIRFFIRDSSYSDVSAFKSAMSGVMLYYELAEPIITDISDLLPEDNFIGVEGGGIITMANEYEYAVPSEITYQIKGASV